VSPPCDEWRFDGRGVRADRLWGATIMPATGCQCESGADFFRDHPGVRGSNGDYYNGFVREDHLTTTLATEDH